MVSKYSHIYVGNYWRTWGTHSGTVQLFEELILEGKNTVLQDQFQEFHNLIFLQANGVASEGASILVFSFWVLNVFSEQPIDDI